MALGSIVGSVPPPASLPLLLVPLDVPLLLVPLLVPLDAPLLLVPLDVPLLLVPLLVPLDVPLLLSDPLLVPEEDSLPEEPVPLDAPLLDVPLLEPCPPSVPSPVPLVPSAAQATPNTEIPRAKRQRGDVRKSWRTRTSSGLGERQAPGTLRCAFCANGTEFLQKGSFIRGARKRTLRRESEARNAAPSHEIPWSVEARSTARSRIVHPHRHSPVDRAPFEPMHRCR